MKYKFKICSIILCLYSGLGLAQPDNFPVGEFELNIGVRPSVPYPIMDNYNQSLTGHGVGPSYTVTVSRHHIIPFNALRSFYNRVSERNRLRNLSGFFNSYSNNLYLYAGSNGVDCARLGNDLIDAGNLAQSQSYGLVRAGGNNSALGFDTFEQFYAWLPGNLFIGPNNRSDDPGEGFESNAAVVVGTANFDILSRAYGNILLYLSNNDDSLLNSISADLTRISQRQNVYSLNPESWEYINGKYRLSNQRKLLSNNPPDDKAKYSDECTGMSPTFKNILHATVLSSKSEG